MTQPFLALITPLATGGYPDQGLPGQPPGIWPSPGYPSHPIAPGGPPPVAGWTPPGYQPSHPIAPGGQPPYPSTGPGFPTNPIVIPPDSMGPGVPEHPIVIPPDGIWPSPGYPSHPIVIPPDTISPGVPSQPIYIPPEIWPGPGAPTHPIAPGGGPSTGPGFPTQPIYLPEVPDVPQDTLALVMVKVPGQPAQYLVINTNNEVKPLPPVAGPKGQQAQRPAQPKK
jgi:hypothetical protein